MEQNKLIHPIKLKKSHKIEIFTAAIFFMAVISLFLVRTVVSSEYEGVSITDKFSQIFALSQTPVSYQKAPSSFELPSAKWVPQTFNNCGPAATAMVLQYFGYNVSQEETKAHLRTNPDDKNVFIAEISAYLKEDYGIQNKVMFNGDLQTIKTLVANGIYVVVEDWLHPNEDIGHVLIIRGYDDSEGVLIADDSYFGVGQKYSYLTWDETQWRPYNREFMPVYTREKENLVKAIIGENWSEKTMYENAIKSTQAEIFNSQGHSDPGSEMYLWFNLGTDYYALGDYEKAKDAFEKSQSIGWSHRMLWYNIDPVKTYNALGDYQKAIDTANLGLWYNDNFAEMHYEKYLAFKGLGDNQNSELELQKALQMDTNITKKLQ